MLEKITYTKVGDYNIPNLYVPRDTNYNNGKYGRAYLRYIKQYKMFIYIY